MAGLIYLVLINIAELHLQLDIATEIKNGK